MKTSFIFLWVMTSLSIAKEISAQPNEVSVLIKSEHKQLFNESGMLKQIADDIYYAKLEQLSNSIMETFRKGMNGDEKIYSERIELSTNTSIQLKQQDERLFISYLIPKNRFSCKETTEDIIPGVGYSRNYDPSISILYDIRGDFELIQNGKAESIRLNNPIWTVEEKDFKVYRNSVLGNLLPHWAKFYGLNSSESYLPKTYLILNDIQENLSDYIQSKVINNPDLLKEFEIDENRELKVVADLDNSTLIFQHSYSPKGMVTRSATKDAGIIKEGPKSVISTVPVSTTPSGANKKPGTLSSPKGQINSSSKKF